MFGRRLAGALQRTRKNRQITDDVNREEHGQAPDEQLSAPINSILKKDIVDGTKGSGYSQSDNAQRGHPGSPAPPNEPLFHRKEHYERGFGGLPAPWESAFVKNLFTGLFRRLTKQAHGTLRSYISFNPSLDSRVCIGPDITNLKPTRS